ncbi:MAG: hypothetical protein ABIV48_07055 [Pyrinomonadaceae bacterium]
MHCPSCGQQQISTETKFCSRCGLPLTVVSEVLSHGGYLPQLAELNNRKKKLFSRRNGLGFSLIWALFFLLIMAPFWGIVEVEELAGISAIVGIFGGLILMISSLMFLPRDVVRFDAGKFAMPPRPEQYNMPDQQAQSALPPERSVPASVYAAPKAGNWRDTNDLEPSSITEGTTRLLDKDEI